MARQPNKTSLFRHALDHECVRSKFSIHCLALLLVLLSLTGCTDHLITQKLPAFHNQPQSAILFTLGPPARQNDFTMATAGGEFRIELQNTYPLRDSKNADIPIREFTWKDGDYWITLWLHQVNGQWVVLDSCRHHKDIVF